LFTLSILAVAIGIAVGAAGLFDVSFALGAFFAGVVISESDLSHQAGADVLPFQDAFAVLFFVSVGMLFDPAVLLEQPLHVLITLLIVMAGKSLAAFFIVLLFRHPVRIALTISASLAQIGEFSFILAGLGVSLGLLPEEGRNLILAVAILSITLNPVMFGAIPASERWLRARPRLLGMLERSELLPMLPDRADQVALRDHAVIIGYGRVGSAIGDALTIHDIPHVVIEQDRMVAEALRRRGIAAIFGDATRTTVLSHAHLDRARLLIITAPDKYQARRIVDLAREMNRAIDIVVRTHSQRESEYLEQQGVGRAVMGERELALGMAYYSLIKLGQTDDQADGTIETLRQQSSFRAPGRPSRMG
jgi:CPA2 family monovalent cation:H+ antiporter-2